jgi:hypothetical protein
MKKANHGRLADVVKSGNLTVLNALAKARERFPDINRNGITPAHGCEDWSDEPILTAMAALRKCDKTKHATIGSYSLKHIIERAVGRYIANGDVVVAAIALGFFVKPSYGPNVGIGVRCADLRRLEMRQATCRQG